MSVMKFLLIILVIRYVFILLDKMGKKNEKIKEPKEEGKVIHPSAFNMRW